MQRRYSWSSAAEERLGERIERGVRGGQRSRGTRAVRGDDAVGGQRAPRGALGALQKDVSRLTAMVGVLTEALAQRGVIDMNWALGRLGQAARVRGVRCGGRGDANLRDGAGDGL